MRIREALITSVQDVSRERSTLLNRQRNETFHVWAKRIQGFANELLGTRPAYPRSNVQVEALIKQIINRPIPPPRLIRQRFEQRAQACKGWLKTFVMDVQGLWSDADIFLRKIRPKIEALLNEQFEGSEYGVKFQLVLQAELIKANLITGREVVVTAYFNHVMTQVLDVIETSNVVLSAQADILQHIEDYMRDGSGWVFRTVTSAYLNVGRYQPLRGRSYIPLPKYIQAKKAVVNVKNDDTECFRWAILSALHPVDVHAERLSNYVSYKDELNFDGIKFPVTCKSWKRFEQQNDISLSVYGYTTIVHPMYISRLRKEKHVDLLLITSQENSHYCWIKNFNRLLSDQTKRQNKKYFCRFCLWGFSRNDLLVVHEPLCCQGPPQRIEMPRAEDTTVRLKNGQVLHKPASNILQFFNYHKQLKVPYIIYADFEALTMPILGVDNNPPAPTQQYQLHEPCSYCYIVVRSDGYSEEQYYTEVQMLFMTSCNTFKLRSKKL